LLIRQRSVLVLINPKLYSFQVLFVRRHLYNKYSVCTGVKWWWYPRPDLSNQII